MANKADKYYFKNLQDSAKCACDAAEYLVECLTNFDTANHKEMLETMHRYENEGDVKKHEMSTALAKAFVTPVDREDIALISQNIECVTDIIEEILQKIYMCNVKTLIPNAILFAQKICSCCNSMHEMLCEFVNFKRPAKLYKLIIKLNDLEEECDKLYIDSFHNLENDFDNTLDILSWRTILDKMENCADACEHVGDCVDMVVMKNT